jgi:glycosyltransferase involved in cell wall biosynthesis
VQILFLTQVLPYPLDAGPKVRAYHMLRHLSARHEVTLVSFVRGDDTPAAVEHLRGICAAVHTAPIRRAAWRSLRAGIKGLATGLPIVIARDEMGEMIAALRRLVRETPFDVVHADQLSMAGYGRMAARAGAGRSGARLPRTVLDEHNAVYVLAQRIAQGESGPLRRAIATREAQAFARYEAAMCRAYDALLTVTAEDRDRLLALCPPEERPAQAGKFTVVPICVDPAATPAVRHVPAAAPTILHLGTMFWPPNVAGVLWFAREVLPLIHRELPAARFVVVGKNPPAEVRALAADPRVEVTGYVTDPAPYLAAADAFVVPLHAAAGMRVKIVDGWVWGLPIVATPIGAEGIEVCDGENILIAGDAAAGGAIAFAAATLRLLTDAPLNARLRTAGRAWVEEKYAWQVAYRKVDEVYSHLLAG